jgi:NADPH:quinone reductase-like Zn-dependent oxidoreductase
MKAFAVGRYGSKDGVQMREMPEPGIGQRDVLVAVRAASVNLLDAKIRDGEFKRILPYRVPFVLGNDLAGRVVRVGPAVRSFAPGDEVYARPGTDIDRVIPFESAKDAMAYVESGRAKGKVIITMADLPATHPVTLPAARTPAPLTTSRPRKGHSHE